MLQRWDEGRWGNSPSKSPYLGGTLGTYLKLQKPTFLALVAFGVRGNVSAAFGVRGNFGCVSCSLASWKFTLRLELLELVGTFRTVRTVRTVRTFRTFGTFRTFRTFRTFGTFRTFRTFRTF